MGTSTTNPSGRGIVLLSGGLDSATVLAMARARGVESHCLSFRYGQRHDVELRAARRVAEALGAASWRVVDVDLRAFGGSALTADLEVPRGRSVEEMGQEIPITYVPARNTIFLSFALGLAEVIDARDLYIGANAVDYSGYPDCRSEFLEAFERLANLGTRVGVEAARGIGGSGFRVHAPLVAMSKAEIIRTGHGLGLDYGLTWSCYDPQHVPVEDRGQPSGAPRACGACDSCALRRRGFIDAGIPDPTPYA